MRSWPLNMDDVRRLIKATQGGYEALQATQQAFGIEVQATQYGWRVFWATQQG